MAGDVVQETQDRIANVLSEYSETGDKDRAVNEIASALHEAFLTDEIVNEVADVAWEYDGISVKRGRDKRQHESEETRSRYRARAALMMMAAIRTLFRDGGGNA